MRVSIRIVLVVVVALLAFAPEVARAQAPGLVPVQPVPAPAAATLPSAKSPAVALGLSLVGYLVGLAIPPTNPGTASIALTVQFVGPSLGHIYAGRVWTTGLGLRIGGIATAVIGAAMYANNKAPCADYCVLPSASNSTGALGIGMLVVGATAMAVGAIHDIATAPRAAREYNRAHGLDLTIAPAPIRTASSTAPGLALAGRF